MNALDPLLRAAIAAADPDLADAMEILVNEYAKEMLAILTVEQPGLYDQILNDRQQRFAALFLTHVQPQGCA